MSKVSKELLKLKKLLKEDDLEFYKDEEIKK